jgi:hypothetical protein
VPENAYGDAYWADLACMLTHADAWDSAYCVCWIVACKTNNRTLASALGQVLVERAKEVDSSGQTSR